MGETIVRGDPLGLSVRVVSSPRQIGEDGANRGLVGRALHLARGDLPGGYVDGETDYANEHSQGEGRNNGNGPARVPPDRGKRWPVPRGCRPMRTAAKTGESRGRDTERAGVVLSKTGLQARRTLGTHENGVDH